MNILSSQNRTHTPSFIKLIDTHAHLTSERILPVLDDVVARAKKAGIEKIVNICTDEKSFAEGVLLHQDAPWIFNAAATTPHDVEKEGAVFFPLVERSALEGRLIAIGETGLDYFYEHSNRQEQQRYLSLYFSLARQAKLPLIFHCRDAFADLFSMADQEYRGYPALLHCFTGNLDQAREVLNRGWYLSISGIVTFKKSAALREVAQYVPLDRLVIETDAPYLAPQSHRGQLNEPAYLAETARVVAEAMGIPIDKLAAATVENAERFFSFSKLP